MKNILSNIWVLLFNITLCPWIFIWGVSRSKTNVLPSQNSNESISQEFVVELDRLLDKESFFVITTIYNPSSFRSRYRLYRNFVRHMKDTNAQLITVECIFPSLNQTEFQVTDSNNPNHIQLKSQSVYWMKEDLINIAVERLPLHAQWVAWVDADIHFQERNWIDLTIQQLKKYVVVQLFENAKYLGPLPQQEVLRNDYSFGYSAVHGILTYYYQTKGEKAIYAHPGYAWAMSVKSFRQIGLFGSIIGGGDLNLAFSLSNLVSKVIDRNFDPKFKEAMGLRSKEIFSNATSIANAENKKVLGYVPMTISHFWHGAKKDRQHGDRWKILIAHKFNSNTDARRTTDGLLEFVDKETKGENITSSLQDDLLLFFQRRNEDSLTNIIENSDRKKKQTGVRKPCKNKHSSLQDHSSPSGYFNGYKGAIKRSVHIEGLHF